MGSRPRKPASEEKLLAIDIGNTHTVLGVFTSGRLDALWRISSGVGRTADEIGALISALGREHLEGLRRSRRVCICSVVPALTGEYETMARRLCDARSVVVSAALKTGVKIELPDPSSIGADRIANAVAVAGGRLPAIVVDMGTATTFDVVMPGPRYVGGSIAPGIRTSADELFRRAARLPKVEIRKPPRAIGQTTEASIQSGVYFGAVAVVDGIVRRIAAELRSDPRVIATGGLASLVEGDSETIQEVDEGLTLRGLLRIEELNRTVGAWSSGRRLGGGRSARR